MKSSHLLICSRPTYLHSKNKQLSVTMEHSNYFTLREHSLARNRQIKVKQWRWEKRSGRWEWGWVNKCVDENFSFKRSVHCMCVCFCRILFQNVRFISSVHILFFFINSAIFFPCFSLNYFQIKIPVIVRFFLFSSFASNFFFVLNNICKLQMLNRT